MIHFFLLLVLTTPLFATDFSPVDKIVNDAIKEKTLPGGVLLIGKGDKVLYEKAYQSSFDTLYDIASLTKLSTAIAIMMLKEDGKLKLNDKLSKFYPEFKTTDKENITIEEVLRHQAGLAASVVVKSGESYDAFIKRTLTLPLAYKPKSKTVYSDVGFIILGNLVEKISHVNLGKFAKVRIFFPLRMKKTTYQVSAEFKKFCAPTNPKKTPCIPHDPKAENQYPKQLGHAGVFSTYEEMKHLALMFLGKGQYQGTRILSEESIKEMISLPKGEIRGLGVDLLSPYARAPRGEIFPKGISYGHTGFTGTTLWIDPKANSFYVFLSNRVYLGEDKTGKSFTDFRYNLSTQIGKLLQ